MEDEKEQNTGESDAQSLLSMFEEGLALYNNLGKIDEPTNSPTVQLNIKKSIRIFEDSTRLVSLAGIFSSNESIDEVSTENLRYLLLPALLGSLCLKLTTGERKDITETAEVYYKDFLQRCTDYGLCNYKFNTCDTTEQSSTSEKSDLDKIKDEVNTRAGKIQRFKEQKELSSKLEDLKKNMENENVDDEVKRNYFLTMLKLFIYEAVDELGSIESEKQILQYMATIAKDEKPKSKFHHHHPPQPLRPVIITKDTVQKAVFGAGYPSLPIMTVEEFYDKRVRDGIFPDPSKQKAGPTSLQDAAAAGVDLRDELEEEGKEKRLEDDDPQLLEEMRRRDEFKDDHRRGWGNRMNRS